MKLIKQGSFIQLFLRKLLLIFAKSMPDKLFLELRYYVEMGKKLDFKSPKTLNEKLQWLKINNTHPEYAELVDKISVKEVMIKKLGEDYVVPLLGIWNTVNDIDLDKLPNKFVLKTNHSGGNTGVIVCKDKNLIDIKDLRKKLKKSLKSNIYWGYREYPYKYIVPQIFAEELLESASGEVDDYKFYCFDGYVDCVLVCVDRQNGDPKFYFFDKNWTLKRYNIRGKRAPENFSLPKPSGLEEMFEIASQLSKGYPFVRVDLYNIDGKIYFGEMTFFPASGFDANRLPEIDLYFGNLLRLPKA